MSDVVVNDCPRGGPHVFSTEPERYGAACLKCGGQRAASVGGDLRSAISIDGVRLREVLVADGWTPPGQLRMTYRPKQGVANPTQGLVNFHGPGGQTTQVLYEHEARAIAVALGIELEVV